jgi:DHA2 family multidrug resistance protein
MPIVGQLTTRIPAKYLIAFGWLSMAIAMLYSTKRIDLDINFKAAMWLRVAQAAPLPLLFVPVTLASYVGLAPERSNDAAGLINFMRNIGSSVGTSMVTTLLARRSQYHQSMLASYTSNYDPVFRNQAAGLGHQLIQSGTSAADAQHQAYGVIYQSMQHQAQLLSYIDIYKLLAIGAGVMFLLAFAMRKNDPRAGGEVAVG